MEEFSDNELLFASAHASANFAQVCLEPYQGNLRAISSFVTPEAEIMHWHEFGDLEGPGWAANAVGGAHLLYLWGEYCQDDRLKQDSIALLRHILEDGFIDEHEGLIWPYYDLARNQFCWNYIHGMEWLCPGSLAKIGVQLIEFARVLPDETLVRSMNEAAQKLADWLLDRLSFLENGWLPRRITPQGDPYPLTPNGNPDPIFDHSADGLFILHLCALLNTFGHTRFKEPAVRLGNAFVDSGGIFGSINHDTYDSHESAAYACSFRILHQSADLLHQNNWRHFAYSNILPALDQFRMLEDRNGLPTKGLLWMERSWNTAYLWENAEAAQAYLEAWKETGETDHLSKGKAILEAIVMHHHGNLGFLTEGVDWDNYVSSQHHVDMKEYEDIRYTEPLLNNMHFLLPTLNYFHLANVLRPEMDFLAAIKLVTERTQASRIGFGTGRKK